MTDPFSKDKFLLDEIMSEARSLAEDLQKDILDYIRNMREPRSYPRISKTIEVDVLIGDKIIQSNAKDISASGVFIRSGIKPEIGTTAKVVFSLPGQSRPFKLSANVVRTESGGIGLCFSEMTSYARQTLDKLLQEINPEI